MRPLQGHCTRTSGWIPSDSRPTYALRRGSSRFRAVSRHLQEHECSSRDNTLGIASCTERAYAGATDRGRATAF
jgi:hypothetical protein